MKRSLEGEEERKLKKPKIDHERDVIEKTIENFFTHMELDIPYNFGIVSSYQILVGEHLMTEFNNTSDYKSKVNKKIHSPTKRINSILYCTFHILEMI
jgi:hypothetical protein